MIVNSGSQFDPVVVEAMLRVVAASEAVALPAASDVAPEPQAVAA